MAERKLPVGIERFEEIRKAEFYYVDKTGLLRELLQNWAKVNLFTRPRRFGKSLNMSMLKCFFEPDGDKTIFDGLEISRDTALCQEYMGKYPVVSVSLKGINGASYADARAMAVRLLNEEARRLQFLLDSPRLSSHDKAVLERLLDRDMDDSALYCGLRDLSELLGKHYGREVIILIDEYDVPLAKAFDRGYYDQMVLLIRNMFEQALKTNSSLKFAVLTGCLRISKESIFTGLNNLKVLSVKDVQFDEYFGFTDAEVRALLEDYGLSEFYDTVREWYDGYHFGNVDVYCPWDVINYCDALRADREAQPQNYWSNTSSNDVVRRLIEQADNGTVKKEIERLVAGETVEKEVHPELTYKDLYASIENLWSVLYTTGYLTMKGKPAGDVITLVIPNREIRNIFTRQIMEYFKESIRKDGASLDSFCDALKNGDAKAVEEQFQSYLIKTISIRDTFARKPMKENFYHGILLGLLGFKASWGVFSNREAGDGYSDILIEIEDEGTGIVIEVKYAENGNLEEACREALRQIEKKRYDEQLREEGMEKILKYGIACYKKRCRIAVSQ